MRASNEDKQKSRARILQAASRRFREHGIAASGLADIMKDAGLTHGGFYKHFPDKESLVRAALAEGFGEVLATLGDGQGDGGFRMRYLSQEHRDARGIGCPVAALGGEIARTDEATRRVMADGVEALIALLQGEREGVSPPRGDVIRQIAEMVGAVVVARAVEGPLSDEILAAVRRDGREDQPGAERDGGTA